MTVRDTSITCYHQLSDAGILTGQCREVMVKIHTQALTDYSISELCQLFPNHPLSQKSTMSARLHSLKDKKYLVECAPRFCRVTNRMITPVGVRPRQLELAA